VRDGSLDCVGMDVHTDTEGVSLPHAAMGRPQTWKAMCDPFVPITV